MLTPTAVADIAARLAAAPHRAKRAFIEDEARRLGLKPNAVYRALAAFRGRTRKPRADKGRPRGDKAAIMAVAEIKAKASDPETGRRLPTDLAIRVAEESGAVAPGLVTRATFDRQAARQGLFGPMRVYSRYQAERSNELHHVDTTGSKYFRVVGQSETGDWLVGARKPEYARNRKEEPLGLWLTGVVDDHSRVSHAIYDVAAGESAKLVCDCLARIWSGDPRCPIRGMPDMLLCDHGPFKRSQEGQHFLEALGVQDLDRMPKSPWVGGKVERPWRTHISRFEIVQLLRPQDVLTLTELNRRFGCYLAEWNTTGHPWFLGEPKLDVYAKALDPASVRYAPENVADAQFREDWRRVNGDGTVRYGNQFYLVSDEIVGRWVRILRNATGDLVVEHEGRSYPATPFMPNAIGDYRAHRQTPAAALAAAAAVREVASLPYAGEGSGFRVQGSALTLHTGERAQIVTPFDARERVFVNHEEQLLAFARWVGRPVHALPEATRDLILAIMAKDAYMREAVLYELAMEVKARFA